MSDIITTLHPANDENTNLYPNIKKENIPNSSVNMDRLDDDVIDKFGNIDYNIDLLRSETSELHPSGVDTSTNILAFTTNKGVYIASDNGYWYYWNGSQYVQGGLFINDNDITIKNRNLRFNVNTDFNNLNDGIYGMLFSSSSYISNGVSEFADGKTWKYFQISYDLAGTSSKYIVQQMTSQIPNITYTRQRVNGTWSSWSNTSALIVRNLYVNTSINFNSLDDGIYGLLFTDSSYISNGPDGIADGQTNNLIQFSYKYANQPYVIQIVRSQDGLSNWYRQKVVGTWSSWVDNTSKQHVYECPNAVGLYTVIPQAMQYDDSIVILTGGEYDVSSLIESNGDIVLGKNIKIIGMGNARIICHYTGDSATVMSQYSVFRKSVGGKGFTLENITLDCSRIRYCVHDDNGSNTDYYQNNYINCNMKMDNTDNTNWHTPTCIGGGLGGNAVINIDGGIYDGYSTDPTLSQLYDISYHNSGYNQALSKIFIKNVYMKHTARFSYFGDSTLVTQVIVSNSSVIAMPFKEAETSTSYSDNINLITFNIEVRTS